jgi:Uma2 family endonuclease
MATPTNLTVTLRLAFDEPPASWTLSDERMPESYDHLLTVDLLWNILRGWVARTGRDAWVGRAQAVRWDERHKQVGVDPDVCVVEPRPPEGDSLKSLLAWRPGHRMPRLAIEVVSTENSNKDYLIAPEKYAACGVEELWIFDPLLAGPAGRGPVRLQVWRRTRNDDGFERVYAGEGPTFSPYLSAWLFAVDEGRRLRIADDRDGTRWWMTPEEAERAAKEEALLRIAELERALRQK